MFFVFGGLVVVPIVRHVKFLRKSVVVAILTKQKLIYLSKCSRNHERRTSKISWEKRKGWRVMHTPQGPSVLDTSCWVLRGLLRSFQYNSYGLFDLHVLQACIVASRRTSVRILPWTTFFLLFLTLVKVCSKVMSIIYSFFKAFEILNFKYELASSKVQIAYKVKKL